MAEMTPADYGAQAARPTVHLTEQTIQRDALARLLNASRKTMDLWVEHGLGDDHEVSEAAYYEMHAAIEQAAAALGREA